MMMLIPLFGFASYANSDTNLSGNVINGGAISPDSTIVKLLGDTITDVLFYPKKVSVYKLQKVFDTVAVNLNDCENFAQDSLLTELSAEEIGIMKFVLLTDTSNYKLDTFLIRSQYYPQLEFVFQKKKEMVKVRISENDYSWTIICNNKVVCRFNYQDKKLVERFCKLFL